MLKNIDFDPGKVTYNDFDIDLIYALTQEHLVDEKDLLQVEYPNNVLIDVGWHTDSFIVSVAKNYNWENLIIKKKCKNIEELEKILKECIIKIREMINR